MHSIDNEFASSECAIFAIHFIYFAVALRAKSFVIFSDDVIFHSAAAAATAYGGTERKIRNPLINNTNSVRSFCANVNFYYSVVVLMLSKRCRFCIEMRCWTYHARNRVTTTTTTVVVAMGKYIDARHVPSYRYHRRILPSSMRVKCRGRKPRRRKSQCHPISVELFCGSSQSISIQNE